MTRVTKKWKRSRRYSRKQCGGRRRQTDGASNLKGGFQQGGCNCGGLHQTGGGVNMPLAYFQDGTQLQGTYAEPTGTGLAGASGGWVRAPLSQTGGSWQKKQQQGGFSPTVMGSFLVNGSRLIPVAGYMGYRMMDKAGRTRRAGRQGRRGYRRTRRDRK